MRPRARLSFSSVTTGLRLSLLPRAAAAARPARTRAFPDQVALELAQGSEQVEHEPAVGRGGVDRLGQLSGTPPRAAVGRR